MKILLVDDEHDLVSTLAERLSLRDIDADWVSSGEDALTKLQNTTYDIAVLDMKMPHNGGHTFEQLKKINADLKIILTSGYTEDYGIRELVKQVCNDFLQKPFSLKILSKKIKNALN